MDGWDILLEGLLGWVVDHFPAPEIKGQKKWVNTIISILWFIGICLVFVTVVMGAGYLLSVIVVPFVVSMAGGLMVVAVALLFFIMFLLLRCIGGNNRKKLPKNLRKECVTLRMPKRYFWTGAFGVAFVSILSYVAFIQGEDNGLTGGQISLVPLWVIALSVIFSYFNWKIELSKNTEYFSYRNIIGWRYKIEYEDVLFYESKTKGIVVTGENKIFRVSYKVTHYERLIETFSEHGIEQFRFHEWQKAGDGLTSEQEQDNEPVERQKPRGNHFYKGKRQG